MDVLWIILIGVLLLAGVAGCLIVRRYESREAKPTPLLKMPSELALLRQQLKESHEDARAEMQRRRTKLHPKIAASDSTPERKQPDIPVWRDKPKDN